MESSLGSSELFFRQVTIFSSNHGTTFLSKKDVVFFYSISLKRNLHLPIGLAKKTEEILTQNIILKIYVINFPIYKLSNGTANEQEWEDVNYNEFSFSNEAIGQYGSWRTSFNFLGNM